MVGDVQGGNDRGVTIESLLKFFNMRHQRGKCFANGIGKQTMLKIGLVSLPLTADNDLPWHANDDRIGRGWLDHHCIRANTAMCANGDGSQHFRASADDHMVFNGGMPFGFL